MRYDRDKLKTMAENVNLVEYIGIKYPLKKCGLSIYRAHCPFHAGDNTASLTVHTDTNSWYCYGCKRGSDIYDWLREDEGLSFEEAVIKVIGLNGGDVNDIVISDTVAFYKELNKAVREKKPDTVKRKKLDLYRDYLDVYEDELPEEWLEEGMTEDALQHYRIRIDKKYSRIVYPVFDAENNLISVKGRTRVKNYKECGIAKYTNYYKIGELDFFQGWQQALPEIIRTRKVIIFEGIKSCIKAYGFGIGNTIASETSLLSDEQVNLLIKTGISEVIIAWDKDQDFGKIRNNKNVKKLTSFADVSIVVDRFGLLGEKDAPVDKGKEVFERLLEGRRRL